jgi:hypothetical protein
MEGEEFFKIEDFFKLKKIFLLPITCKNNHFFSLYLSAAPIKSLNNGCGSMGRDLNSG